MTALTGLVSSARGATATTVTVHGPLSATSINSPIELGVDLLASIQVLPPEPQDAELDNQVFDAADQPYSARLGSTVYTPAASRLSVRLLPDVSVAYPAPIISEGHPVVPIFTTRLNSSMTLIEGAHNIHWIPDPDPVAGDPIYNPPPAGGSGDYRWTVRDLPDPPDGGYYWLGDPDSRDGTSGTPSNKQSWPPYGGSGPAWRSIYPYKPSVRAHVYYGPGGRLVTLAKALRLNIEFIEHMWLDFGAFQPKPFTWLIAGIIVDYPYQGYQHTLLDMGRNPRSGGIGDLDDTELAGSRVVHEALQDHSPQIVCGIEEQITATDHARTHRISQPFGYTTRPHLWFGVFDGATSMAGSVNTGGKRLRRGRLDDSSTRYVLLGRRNGVLSREQASHLVVFEIRFFNQALTEAQIDSQYGQLSSTWRYSDYD